MLKTSPLRSWKRPGYPLSYRRCHRSNRSDLASTAFKESEDIDMNVTTVTFSILQDCKLLKCLLEIDGIGLPWWLSGKESNHQRRRLRLDPWSGRIPHAAEQLSPCATTIEPVLQSPGAAATESRCHNYWSPCALDPMLHDKRSHHKEKPCTAARG